MRIIIFLLFLPVIVAGQHHLSLIDTYMKGQTLLYGFNGNVLVSKKGKVIYQRSFGYADFTTRKELDGNSVFDIGSIAKEFTAVGILLLKDKGQISYSDTLEKFFPDLPYTSITVAQLLTHTSGIPSGYELVEKYFDHNRIATNDDLISLLKSKRPPPLFKPGENLMYSGTGFNLLACIIEKISGQTYNNYMNEQVFKPLKMMHTRVANSPRSAGNIPGLATGYVYSDSLNKYISADHQPSGWTSYFTGITGEGMILTTAGDLFKWDRALRNHTLLKEKTQQEMLTVHAEKKFPAVSFGYGIRVGKNEMGNYVFHNGSFPGYLAMHLRYTDADITVIVLSNNETHAEFIADGLAAIALKKDILLPYLHKESVQAKISDTYSGKYMLPLSRPPYMAVFPVEFVKRNGILYIQSDYAAEIRLVPESGKKYFYANGTDQQIEFETDNSGNISRVWHIAWGIRKEAKRIE